jgi:hypothetical protein
MLFKTRSTGAHVPKAFSDPWNRWDMLWASAQVYQFGMK